MLKLQMDHPQDAGAAGLPVTLVLSAVPATLPVDPRLSPEPGNILQLLDSGLFAAALTVGVIPVSADAGNILEERSDGLFAEPQWTAKDW